MLNWLLTKVLKQLNGEKIHFSINGAGTDRHDRQTYEPQLKPHILHKN